MSPEPQLQLKFEGKTLVQFTASASVSPEPQLHLLLEMEPEAARWRRRSMFLLSVILHGIFVLILLFEPSLFRRGASLLGLVSVERVQPQRETTFLVLPPDLLRKRVPPPNTNILSDKNRRAQGRSPVIDPNGLRMPYSRGNTKLPELPGSASKAPPAPPPQPPPAPAAQAQNAAPGKPGQPTPPAPEPKQEAQLRLMDVPHNTGSVGGSGLRLPTAGEAIQRSLQAATQGGQGGRGSASVPGPGEGISQFNNLNPNFSTEAPIILSDTMGVDFGPYLARVVYVVRRNWYAVIPESARLGEKGRVGIVFEILKDGSVPQLRLVASSGAEPLDRAALSAIRAANPFPPLPEEFTGKHLVLQFIFLYNMGYTP